MLSGSNEILAALITASLSAVGFILARVFAPTTRIQWSQLHQFSYLLTKPEDGSKFVVYTRQLWLSNQGRRVADQVEVILNFAPQHFELWPHLRHRVEPLLGGNRIAIIFDQMNPKESVTVGMINVGTELPGVTNVRWRGGSGKYINLHFIRKFKWYVDALIVLDMLLGVIATVYLFVRMVVYLSS